MRTNKDYSALLAAVVGDAVVGNASKRCNLRSVTLGGVTHYNVTHYNVTLGGVTHYVRAAMVLLMMLLTATTAGAGEYTVKYQAKFTPGVAMVYTTPVSSVLTAPT